MVGVEPDRARRLLEATSDFVWFIDGEGAVTAANPAAVALLGWDLASSPRAADAFSVASRVVIEVDAFPKVRAGETWTGELTLRSATGEGVPASVVFVADADGDERWIAALARDLRTAKRLDEQARREAHLDPLTGMPNRAGLDARAAVAMAGHDAVLVLVDVDGLRLVNDAYGLAAGDGVLVEVARRIEAVAGIGRLAARVGPDEFAVLLPGVELPEARAFAEDLAGALAPDYAVGERSIRVTTSAGVAATTSADRTLPRLFQHAELALHAAKGAGGGQVAAYDIDLHRDAVSRSQLRQDLGVALERGQFHLVYQPVVRMADAAPVGTEALLRWQHPELGLVRPDHFVPMLEEAGWIGDVGRWVLGEALGQLAAWDRESPAMAAQRVNVNVSALQLVPGFVAVVQHALAAHGLAPERLTVEVTETGLATDAADATAVLAALHDLGVRIAVDDFGTGYSSLASLQTMPVDQLKIDKSFVDGIAEHGTALTAGVCQMAAALGTTTVAEGVEAPEQAELLQALGCTFGQGYLWSRPLPADEIVAFVAASPRCR
jgi:diguanylate cyclase (GGDEF)-like protein